MAYYRKYRRTGYRYARKGRSGYSMYKLYKSRSSGAQARQIYGLNKKMRAIQRLTKPEIKIAPLVQGSIATSVGGTLVNGVRIFGPFGLTNISAQGDTLPLNYAQLDGRFARIQNITMKGIYTYTMTNATNDLQRLAGFMRVIIIQTKASRATDIAYTDIISTTTAGTAGGEGENLNAFAMIRAPLKFGSSRVIKFLSDKTYMLSDTKQAVNIKTKLKYVRNWYKAPAETGAKGNVYMFVMLYNQDTDGEANVSNAEFNYVSKCVYTDA